MSTRMNDPAAGSCASSVGGGNKPDGIRKKTTLWSYILPLTGDNNINANNNDNAGDNNNTTRLPTTSPSDRNAVSIRLALGDTQASLQLLSDRVDRVLDHQRQEAKKVEHLIGGIVQSVERAFTAVAESNVAHTSKLEEALSRCARLEQALSAQSKVIADLGDKCDTSVSETTKVSHRVDSIHDNVMSLLPVIPLLQAVPTEIQNSQLKITQSLEHALDRSSQNQYTLLSAETKSWMSEQQAKTSASLDKLRDDVRRELDAWSGALSMHRQETSAMFSAALAGIRNTASGQNLRHSSTGQDQGSGTPQTALAPSTTHTVDTRPRGHSSSVFVAYTRESEKPQVEHAAKNPASSSRQQSSIVHDKNSNNQVLPGRVLVEDTQSTALSSLPDEDQPEQDESMTFGGRGFGALGKRASSALGSFTNPGSPAFTAQRRPFVQGSASAQPLQPAPNIAREQTAETTSTLRSEPTRDTTLGRSSPNQDPSIRSTLKKRPARVEDVPTGPTKRSRKTKTRMLMDSQELLMVDSSPER